MATLSQADIDKISNIMDWLHIDSVAELEDLVLRGSKVQSLGRPREIGDDTRAEVVRLRAAGQSIRQTADALGISTASVKIIMRAYRDKLPTHA
jgi:hypothetical protein